MCLIRTGQKLQKVRTDPIASYNIRITLFAFLGREERNAGRIRYAGADYIGRHRLAR